MRVVKRLFHIFFIEPTEEEVLIQDMTKVIREMRHKLEAIKYGDYDYLAWHCAKLRYETRQLLEEIEFLNFPD